MSLSELEKKLSSNPAARSEFIELLESILYGSRTDAMVEGFGNAFNLFPSDDHLLEARLKEAIHDRFGAYLDWAPISEALWDAVDDFHNSLSDEELALLDELINDR